MVRIVEHPTTVELEAAGEPFTVELLGTRRPGGLAVFMLHGLGVHRDARGLFPALAGRLDQDAVAVLPELSVTEEDDTRVIPFTLQAARVLATYRYVTRRLRPSAVAFVAHSQGSGFSPASPRTPGSQAPGSGKRPSGVSSSQSTAAATSTLSPDMGPSPMVSASKVHVTTIPSPTTAAHHAHGARRQSPREATMRPAQSRLATMSAAWPLTLLPGKSTGRRSQASPPRS